MPLTPGSHLGPYEILDQLGAGGMGEVYRARDTRLDRVVAIKVLNEHLSAQPEVRARFEREARAVSSLNGRRGFGISERAPAHAASPGLSGAGIAATLRRS